ncbi:MAG: hypothetical protein Q9170_002893 [Blastenia crenularia]
MGCCSSNPCSQNGCPISDLRAATLSTDHVAAEHYSAVQNPPVTTTISSSPFSTPAMKTPTAVPATTVTAVASSSPSPPSSPSSSVKTAAIVGGIVGPLAAITIAIALIVWYVQRRRRRRRQPPTPANPFDDKETPASSFQSSSSIPSPMYTSSNLSASGHPPIHELETPPPSPWGTPNARVYEMPSPNPSNDKHMQRGGKDGLGKELMINILDAALTLGIVYCGHVSNTAIAAIMAEALNLPKSTLGSKRKQSSHGTSDDGHLKHLKVGGPQDDSEQDVDSDPVDGTDSRCASDSEEDSDCILHSESDEVEGSEEEFEEFGEFPWLKSFNLINREPIRSNFYRDLKEPSQDTAALAFGLFDRWGCLKSEFREHPTKKGSGVWGKELDEGRFLLIETVSIDEEQRRQGHGTKLVARVWQEAVQAHPDVSYAIVWAAHLNTNSLHAQLEKMTSQEKSLLHQKLHGEVEDFWRATGFRRIGSSPWFARAKGSAHPSHSLSASEDHIRPLALEASAFAEGQLYPYDVTMLPSNKDIEQEQCAPKPPRPRDTILRTNDEDTLSILRKRLETFSLGDEIWQATDNHGNNIMHIMAVDCKTKSLGWLLGQHFAKALQSARNLEGDTPLEALASSLETRRIKTEVGMLTMPMSDEFDGFQEDEIHCLLRLKDLSKPNRLQIAQIKFGCTCGECVAGFLSPRLSFALECQADSIYHMLSFDLTSAATGPEWCEWNKRLLGHVSREVKANMKTNKSLRNGFTSLFQYTSQCLQGKKLPTLGRIQDYMTSEWPPHVRNYLQRGGTVPPALLQCFDDAMMQDKYLGDGEHEELLYFAFNEDCTNEHDRVYWENVKNLKCCRNDREFAFARRQYCKIEGLPEDAGILYEDPDLSNMTMPELMRQIRHAFHQLSIVATSTPSLQEYYELNRCDQISEAVSKKYVLS